MIAVMISGRDFMSATDEPHDDRRLKLPLTFREAVGAFLRVRPKPQDVKPASEAEKEEPAT